MNGIYLRDWRTDQAISIEDFAHRTGIRTASIASIESGAMDYTGEQLIAFAGALGCEPWRILAGPPAAAEFRVKLVAQMLRDICVEAVVTFEDMGRLDELKNNIDAEDFWRPIAAHFESAVETICRASSSHFAVPSGK